MYCYWVFTDSQSLVLMLNLKASEHKILHNYLWKLCSGTTSHMRTHWLFLLKQNSETQSFHSVLQYQTSSPELSVSSESDSEKLSYCGMVQLYLNVSTILPMFSSSPTITFSISICYPRKTFMDDTILNWVRLWLTNTRRLMSQSIFKEEVHTQFKTWQYSWNFYRHTVNIAWCCLISCYDS